MAYDGEYASRIQWWVSKWGMTVSMQAGCKSGCGGENTSSMYSSGYICGIQ